MKIISILINSLHLHRTSKLHVRGTDLHNDEYDRHTTEYRLLRIEVDSTPSL